MFHVCLTILAVVAEERKNRRYNSTRNHNVVYHNMNFFLKCFLIEKLWLGTNVWSLIPCLKKLNSTNCSCQSLSSPYSFLSSSSCLFLSFFPNTVRSIKVWWVTCSGFHVNFALEAKCGAKEIPIECVCFTNPGTLQNFD